MKFVHPQGPFLSILGHPNVKEGVEEMTTATTTPLIAWLVAGWKSNHAAPAACFLVQFLTGGPYAQADNLFASFKNSQQILSPPNCQFGNLGALENFFVRSGRVNCKMCQFLCLTKACPTPKRTMAFGKAWQNVVFVHLCHRNDDRFLQNAQNFA